MITEAAPNQLSKRWDGASQIPQMLDHQDRKSTRLNSSHLVISYAVFCLQKKSIYLCPPGGTPNPTSRFWTRARPPRQRLCLWKPSFFFLKSYHMRNGSTQSPSLS